MQTLLLSLLLLAAVLASAIFDQLIPKVSLPLVQIVLGVLIALFIPGQIDIALDPELFLVLFIAPLLYDEAKETDRKTLWKLKRPVLSLALGLVVATTLCIGFAVHALIPSIPLAAAFALGAALGPTDAVAVSSLSKVVNIPERQKGILRGELLLNDASGIVSFQFAVAAVTTGSFSLLHATGDFLFEFAGGLLVGAVLGFAGKAFLAWAQRLGVENTTFHVLFEVFIPFIVYLAGNALGVSGVIAVVVAGLVGITPEHDAGPSVSRMNIVSSSVWKVLAFALNGVVFVLLGTQLPRAMERTWDDVTISNVALIGYVLLITVLLLGLRFLWVFVMEHFENKREEEPRPRNIVLRDALITSLSGAKGTVTLSIMFSLPYYASTDPLLAFPQRSLLIFLSCGVILCTLLVATFVVPLVAPRVKQKDAAAVEQEMRVITEMLSSVVADLTALQTPQNRRAVQRAIRAYQTRIAKIVSAHDLEDDNVELRLMALRWQREKVELMVKAGEVDPETAHKYLGRLSSTEALMTRREAKVSFALLFARVRFFLKWLKNVFTKTSSLEQEAQQRARAWRKIQLEAHQYALERLTRLLKNPEYPHAQLSEIILHYQQVCNSARKPAAQDSEISEESDPDAIMLLGYQMELEKVQALYEEERISRETAQRLRNNVAVMRMDTEGVI